MHTAALDPRATARALLKLTAQSWALEVAWDSQPPATSSAAAAHPRLAVRHRSTAKRPAQPARRASDVDVTADQWPYWPTYPGLAAHWR